MSLSLLLLASFACAFLYYLSPARFRWVLLLFCSLAIYAYSGLACVPFLLITSFSVWGAALAIQHVDDAAKRQLHTNPSISKETRRTIKEKSAGRKRCFLYLALFLNFGMLALFKYTDPLLSVFSRKGLGLLLPLGISFYTFQSVGYLLDVYHANIKAERNPFRFLLFVSFFPQLIQGPIARYDQLAPQLTKTTVFPSAHSGAVGHLSETPSVVSFEKALLLIVWGFFKKKVLADRAAPFVEAVFADHTAYGGAVIVIAVLLYSLQQYCDFSGGIDLVTGIAELFGIRLTENFRRPYFSVSLGDFWRRWHISLGSWMRDYVFYPIALSKPVSALSRRIKKAGHTQLSRAMSAAVGNLIVFFLVGIWHGAKMNYVLWGLYNGVLLAISALLEASFKRWNERHSGFASSPAFHFFRVIRTFFIVNIGWFFDRAMSGTDAFRMLYKSFFKPVFQQLTPDTLLNMGLRSDDWRILAIGTAILFTVSLLSERNVLVRDRLLQANLAVRWLLLIPFLYFILATFVSGSMAASGFMYAVF